MRDNVRAFCGLAVEHFTLQGPVYEFGSFLVEGQEERADLRNLFPERHYVGCDARLGPGVDRVEDLEAVGLPDHCAGTVVCCDTLEHTFGVQQACREMYRVLRPGGVLVVSVPFHFRIHAYPDDYWRITPSCLLRLLDPFGAVFLAIQGNPKLPHSVMAIAVKKPVGARFLPCSHQMADAFREWLDRQRASMGHFKRLRRTVGALAGGKKQRAQWRSWHAVDFLIHQPADRQYGAVLRTAGALGACAGGRSVPRASGQEAIR